RGMTGANDLADFLRDNRTFDFCDDCITKGSVSSMATTAIMIIQRVIKGISGISRTEAQRVLSVGIVCNWWRKVDPLPRSEVPLRLTDRNLSWHQNRYTDPDPTEGGEEFRRHTPFISTTAGTVQRDTVMSTNTLTPAWQIALRFATDGWKTDGCLFYCY